MTRKTQYACITTTTTRCSPLAILTMKSFGLHVWRRTIQYAYRSALSRITAKHCAAEHGNGFTALGRVCGRLGCIDLGLRIPRL